MTRPTDEQVAALVVEAEHYADLIDRQHRHLSSAALRRALAPFRPDPDAEAVEVMAQAQHETLRASRRDYCLAEWSKASDGYRDGMLAQARAALAALREWEAAK